VFISSKGRIKERRRSYTYKYRHQFYLTRHFSTENGARLFCPNINKKWWWKKMSAETALAATFLQGSSSIFLIRRTLLSDFLRLSRLKNAST
jgi:hypothetical protein